MANVRFARQRRPHRHSSKRRPRARDRMFRNTWDFVSPSSWLGSLAGEEALMSGGMDVDDFAFPTAIIYLPSADERGSSTRDEANAPATTATSGATAEERADESMTARNDEDEGEGANDGDFFADLPLGTRALETQVPADLTPPVDKKTKDGYAYFTYSYSRCATLSDDLELVSSTRRRYEDSGGRLKAVHKRRIGDRMVESTWKKQSADDTEGSHDARVSAPGDSKQQFDKDWTNTPFGKAQAQAKAHGQAHQTIYPDEPPAAEIP
ncbi:hypothetical protein PybrP1_002439 [[Pythium] brassicae (nom. inval.)]|nr:hypothetical protein PybrP1_002439 [[Pythium] brassicae (nom. inval.)]